MVPYYSRAVQNCNHLIEWCCGQYDGPDVEAQFAKWPIAYRGKKLYLKWQKRRQVQLLTIASELLYRITLTCGRERPVAA